MENKTQVFVDDVLVGYVSDCDIEAVKNYRPVYSFGNPIPVAHYNDTVDYRITLKRLVNSEAEIDFFNTKGFTLTLVSQNKVIYKNCYWTFVSNIFKPDDFTYELVKITSAEREVVSNG